MKSLIMTMSAAIVTLIVSNGANALFQNEDAARKLSDVARCGRDVPVEARNGDMYFDQRGKRMYIFSNNKWVEGKRVR